MYISLFEVYKKISKKKKQIKIYNHFSENNFNNISVKIFISSMKKGKYNVLNYTSYHIRNSI